MERFDNRPVMRIFLPCKNAIVTPIAAAAGARSLGCGTAGRGCFSGRGCDPVLRGRALPSYRKTEIVGRARRDGNFSSPPRPRAVALVVVAVARLVLGSVMRHAGLAQR